MARGKLLAIPNTKLQTPNSKFDSWSLCLGVESDIVEARTWLEEDS